ncbi:lysozyme inhibitor LprI family protein [Diaphorobacter caeni]|uniref:lysozyme inhibitor LprI family protein n=1 Tax=Diaphorobacter caeni TaxID=2784387 RepID=UPI00188EBA03|nr:lysozyme inhibitor LprI family protein [Diaphorobacter caeni]MBF5003446.1 DUF1311 domain-containing protein [Diaphorobacter caeni]
MLRSLLLVCATLLPLAAAAQRDPSAESNCYSRLSHDSMRACIKEQSAAATKELESAEKQLASAIQSELHHSKSSARQHLSEANARYRQYRKAQCAFQAQAANGKKSAPDREMLCTTALDLQRAKDLKATAEMLR